MPFLIIWSYQMSEFPAAISSSDSLPLVVNIAGVDSVGLFHAWLRGAWERGWTRTGESWEIWSQLEGSVSERACITTKLASYTKFPCKMEPSPTITDTLFLCLQDDGEGWCLSPVSLHHKLLLWNMFITILFFSFLTRLSRSSTSVFSVCGSWVICLSMAWFWIYKKKSRFQDLPQIVWIRIQVLSTYISNKLPGYFWGTVNLKLQA